MYKRQLLARLIRGPALMLPLLLPELGFPTAIPRTVPSAQRESLLWRPAATASFGFGIVEVCLRLFYLVVS